MTSSYAEIGALLTQARQEMQLSLDEAAKRLHIRPRYLEALEKGRLSDLPGLPYAQGYLRAYAGFLKLDKREIVRRFEQVEGQLARRGFYLPKTFSREKAPRPWMVWGLPALAMAFYLLWAAFSGGSSRPSLVDAPPAVQPAPRGPQKIFADVTCLRPADVLYPPCHAGGGPDFRFFPYGGPENIRAMAQAAKAAPAVPKAPKESVKLPWLKPGDNSHGE